jgi:hypothetical protein
MSLTFLLKTCLYGYVLQGVGKDGSVSEYDVVVRKIKRLKATAVKK